MLSWMHTVCLFILVPPELTPNISEDRYSITSFHHHRTPSVQPRVEPHYCSLVNKSGNEMRSSEGVRELSSSYSKAMVSSKVAASEASWHHRTKKGVSRLEGEMQHLATVRLLKPWAGSQMWP